MSSPEKAPDPEEIRAQELAQVYDQLRALAGQLMKNERAGHTLQPTAVVHEAWLRMSQTYGHDWHEQGSPVAKVARCLRNVLVDHARAKVAKKRGDGAKREPLSGIDGQPFDWNDPLQVLALDEALKELAAVRERQARVVELRWFCQLTNKQAADALDVSVDTIKSDWKDAHEWLTQKLTNR